MARLPRPQAGRSARDLPHRAAKNHLDGLTRAVLGIVLVARGRLRVRRECGWVARAGLFLPFFFFLLLFGEISLALCERVVWLCQLTTFLEEGDA